MQKILDYSLILLFDHSFLPLYAIQNRQLVEIFIRNSLKVPSISRVVEYFDNHILGKSAIFEDQGGRVLD